MSQRPPSILLFDVMSTLVYDPIAAEIPEFFGMSLQELYDRKHPTAWQRFERGEISESAFYNIYLPDRSQPVDGDALRDVLYDAYRWLDGMESLLAGLSEADVELHAFSNYPIWYEIIDDKLQLSRFLDWSFVSWNTGLRKPQKEAYLDVVETLEVDGGDCLFIDNRRDNCLAARQVGIDSIVFESHSALVGEFVERSLLSKSVD